MTTLTRTELAWIVSALEEKARRCAIDAAAVPGTLRQVLDLQQANLEGTARRVQEAIDTKAKRIGVI